MKKFLLNTIIFCYLGATSCFSCPFEITNEMLGKIQKTIKQRNKVLITEGGKTWELKDSEAKETLRGIDPNIFETLHCTNVYRPDDIGGSVSFNITTPDHMHYSITFQRIK